MDGFYLFKRNNGVYYAGWTDGDRRRWKTTGCTRRTDALRVLASLRDSKDRETRSRAVVTLSRFETEFLAHSLAVHRPSTTKVLRSAFREFRLFAGDVPLRELTPRTVEEFLAWKIRKSSVASARRDYAGLRSSFRKAVEWEYLPSNPWERVKKPKPPEVRAVHFTSEEVRTVLAHVPDAELRDIVLTAYFTGMRLGELLSLRWESVDCDAGRLSVRNSGSFTTKSGRERVLPLHADLADMLKARYLRAECALVFHRHRRAHRVDTVSKHFKTACRAAGLGEHHFHSLRHGFATELVSRGIGVFLVARLLGHASVSTTEAFYAHARTENRHDLVSVLPGMN